MPYRPEVHRWHCTTDLAKPQSARAIALAPKHV
jgi:hypothetical protein